MNYDNTLIWVIVDFYKVIEMSSFKWEIGWILSYKIIRTFSSFIFV